LHQFFRYIADLRAYARYALCRPYGTYIFRAAYPGLTPWANIFRPFGLDLAEFLEEHNISGALDRETETDATTRSNPGTAKCSRRVSHLLILQWGLCIVLAGDNTEVKTCDREIENW